MPVLEMHALLVSMNPGGAIQPWRPAGTRIRFGSDKARRVKRCRRPRRTKFEVDVLTMGGTHRAGLASITLYSASLDGGRRLRRREIVALRLPSGGRVQGRVRWRLGQRCGVQLMSPVADFARLLRESRLVEGPRAPSQTSSSRASSLASLLGTDDRNPLLRLRGTLSRTQRLGRQILRWCRSL